MHHMKADRHAPITSSGGMHASIVHLCVQLSDATMCTHWLAWCGPMTRSSSGMRRSRAAPSWDATQPARTSFTSPILARFRFACKPQRGRRVQTAAMHLLGTNRQGQSELKSIQLWLALPFKKSSRVQVPHKCSTGCWSMLILSKGRWRSNQ